MLGQQIGWVLFTENLLPLDSLTPNRLLYPQRVGIEVSQFAETLPRTDAQRGGRVCSHAQRDVNAEVFQQGLIP